MNRRKFLREVFLWSAGLSVAVPRFSVLEVLAQGAVSPQIALAKGKDYTKLVESVMASLGSMTKFVRPGDKVVVKPNIGWDRKPEQAANTNPLIVKAIVEHCLESGAGKVQVFDRTCNEKRRCYTNSGIIDALKSLKNKKVVYKYIDKRKFVPVDLVKGKSLKRYEIYRDVLEADTYINVPIAKHHSISGLTLGLKNVMGVIGGNRGKLHHNLGQNLADLATVVRPKLTFVDATRMLLRNGPSGGRLKDVKIANTLLASPDPVAADAYATTLFGRDPRDIESTVAAYKMGLGEMRLTKMHIMTSVV